MAIKTPKDTILGPKPTRLELAALRLIIVFEKNQKLSIFYLAKLSLFELYQAVVLVLSSGCYLLSCCYLRGDIQSYLLSTWLCLSYVWFIFCVVWFLDSYVWRVASPGNLLLF